MKSLATVFFIAAIAYVVLPEFNKQQPEEICDEESIQTN